MSHNHPRVSYLSILIALSCCFISEITVVAQTVTPPIKFSSQQLALKFNLPRRVAPGNRRSAGKRDCFPQTQNENDVLTALIPKTNLGLTIAQRPTFWFYIPYARNDYLSLEFTLSDQDQEIYTQTLSLAEMIGIIGVNLPETISPLEIDKSYTWRLKIKANCEGNPYQEVYGQVKRVTMAAELKAKLDTATPNEQLNLYSENGFWFDTLTSLIQLRCDQPQNQQLQTDWVNLLSKEVSDLEELIAQPVVSCSLFKANTL